MIRRLRLVFVAALLALAVSQPAAAQLVRPPFGAFATRFIASCGGSLSTSGPYTICTFTANGSLTVTSGTANVWFRIVGGGAGGGGGAGCVGAGGGAGGVLDGTDNIGSGTYSAVVGANGAGSASCSDGVFPTNGSDSSWHGHTATGGGRGGISSVTQANKYGQPGGSGGGSASNNLGDTTAGAGTAGQGTSGGHGDTSGSSAAGGGGGADGAGSSCGGTSGCAGGPGRFSPIFGTTDGGGGGGNGTTGKGLGGAGGGGDGGAGGNPCSPGADGQGGGGGGGSGCDGGKGKVAVAWLTAA